MKILDRSVGKRGNALFSSLVFFDSLKKESTAPSENSAGFPGGKLISFQVKTDKPRTVVLIWKSLQDTLTDKTQVFECVNALLV